MRSVTGEDFRGSHALREVRTLDVFDWMVDRYVSPQGSLRLS